MERLLVLLTVATMTVIGMSPSYALTCTNIEEALDDDSSVIAQCGAAGTLTGGGYGITSQNREDFITVRVVESMPARVKNGKNLNAWQCRMLRRGSASAPEPPVEGFCFAVCCR